jgi:GT2 family glycosyltransferase
MACVRRLQQTGYPALTVLVVDNGSQDGSSRELAGRLPGVEVVQSGENRGYGFGCNVGLRRAIAAEADLIWLVTPDVQVEPGSLLPLVRAFEEDSRTGICGPILVSAGRYLARLRVSPWRGYLPIAEFLEERQIAALPDCVDSDYVDGGCVMLRRAMIEEIGLLREDFFLYYEDTEYALRARDRGWQVRLCPRSLATTRPLDEERHDRFYLMIRNSVLLARVRRKFRVLTVLRYLVAALLHVCRLRRQQVAGFPAVARRAVVEGLAKPLASAPRAARP